MYSEVDPQTSLVGLSLNHWLIYNMQATLVLTFVIGIVINAASAATFAVGI
jgi:hypothetical protein